MKATVKKTKSGQSSAGEVRKSFIVTESGIVETEDDPHPHKPTRRDSAKAKPIIAERRSSISADTGRVPSAGNALSTEDTEQMFKDFNKIQKRKSGVPKLNALDDAKSKLRSFSIAMEQQQKDKDMREKIQNVDNHEIDEIKAKFYSKKADVMMSQFLASKAIVIMSTERRKRREYSEKRRNSSIKGKIGSLIALGKLKKSISKDKSSQPSLALVNKNKGGTGNVNSQLLVGLGKFKKSLALKASESEKGKVDTVVKEDQKPMRLSLSPLTTTFL